MGLEAHHLIDVHRLVPKRDEFFYVGVACTTSAGRDPHSDGTDSRDERSDCPGE